MASTAPGMHCSCDGQGMAASCTLPPDAAGSWAPMMLVVAIGYLLWLKQHDEDCETEAPSAMYN